MMLPCRKPWPRSRGRARSGSSWWPDRSSGRGIALGDLAGSLGGADWRLAGLAAVAFMVQVLVQSAAWRIGMRAGGLGAVPLRHVVAATWIGKAGNALLPGQMGEVGRVLAVRRHIRRE